DGLEVAPGFCLDFQTAVRLARPDVPVLPLLWQRLAALGVGVLEPKTADLHDRPFELQYLADPTLEPLDVLTAKDRPVVLTDRVHPFERWLILGHADGVRNVILHAFANVLLDRRPDEDVSQQLQHRSRALRVRSTWPSRVRLLRRRRNGLASA